MYLTQVCFTKEAACFYFCPKMSFFRYLFIFRWEQNISPLFSVHIFCLCTIVIRYILFCSIILQFMFQEIETEARVISLQPLLHWPTFSDCNYLWILLSRNLGNDLQLVSILFYFVRKSHRQAGSAIIYLYEIHMIYMGL